METMDVIYRSVCGLDVHKKTVVACRRRVQPGGKQVSDEPLERSIIDHSMV